jgi:hypothetical protein
MVGFCKHGDELRFRIICDFLDELNYCWQTFVDSVKSEDARTTELLRNNSRAAKWKDG